MPQCGTSLEKQVLHDVRAACIDNFHSSSCSRFNDTVNVAALQLLFIMMQMVPLRSAHVSSCHVMSSQVRSGQVRLVLVEWLAAHVPQGHVLQLCQIFQAQCGFDMLKVLRQLCTSAQLSSGQTLLCRSPYASSACKPLAEVWRTRVCHKAFVLPQCQLTLSSRNRRGGGADLNKIQNPAAGCVRQRSRGSPSDSFAELHKSRCHHTSCICIDGQLMA
jgi:hypothetical protein